MSKKELYKSLVNCMDAIEPLVEESSDIAAISIKVTINLDLAIAVSDTEMERRVVYIHLTDSEKEYLDSLVLMLKTVLEVVLDKTSIIVDILTTDSMVDSCIVCLKSIAGE